MSPKPVIDAGDRLSSLPDGIISHILSFLETKYAVRTAVLGRRWEGLWTMVSNLDLDDRLVCGPLDVTDPALDLLKRYLQFSRFADEVLRQHKNFNSLTRFRFRFSVEGKGRFWWVASDYRFKRKLVFGPPIEEIDVVMPGKAELGIPESFYTSKNLRVVKLERVILNAAAGSVFLPSLKILQLANVKIKDFESLGRLISGCLVLETLCLKSCYPSNYNGEDRIEVSLPSLKNLKICDSDIVEYICPIEIESPNLEDIYLHRFTELQFKGSSSLPCLDSAYVDFGFKCKTSYHDLIQLLARFSNAKKMCLTGSALLHMSGFHDVHFPVFPKLTHLTIGMGGQKPGSALLAQFSLQTTISSH